MPELLPRGSHDADMRKTDEQDAAAAAPEQIFQYGAALRTADELVRFVKHCGYDDIYATRVWNALFHHAEPLKVVIRDFLHYEPKRESVVTYQGQKSDLIFVIVQGPEYEHRLDIASLRRTLAQRPEWPQGVWRLEASDRDVLARYVALADPQPGDSVLEA